jgi:cytochrome c556
MLRHAPSARALPGLLALLVLAACASQQSAPASQTPLRDQRLHALMVGELDQELARLDALAFDLHLTQTELDAVRSRRAAAIALDAAQLRDSAAEVLGLQPSLALAADEAGRFAALARQLQEAATSLQQQAAAGRLQELSPLLREINATCHSCHSLYRGG